MDKQIPNTVENYFDKEADNYDQRSGGFLWSALRKREFKACMRFLDPQARELILDAGCGAGFYTRELATIGAKIWAVDLSQKMIEQLNGIEIEQSLCGDLATIELNVQFDKILCAGALEFCPDPEAVIKNLSAHLNPGGRLILLAPLKGLFCTIYKKFHLGHGIAINTFTKDELTECCEKLNLKFIEFAKPTFSAAFRFDKQL